MILTSLILFPVMAYAQASTSTETKPSTSAMTQAELTQPATPAMLAMNAAAATPAANVRTLSASSPAVVRESIQFRTADDFTNSAKLKTGALEYAMIGSTAESTLPSVTRAVEVDLSDQELAERPAVSNVVLHAMVDAYGIPRDVAVTRSAGSVVDRKAIEAVSQFRFKPATLDNRPTSAWVSITIKIQKP
jgi:TonB family protein